MVDEKKDTKKKETQEGSKAKAPKINGTEQNDANGVPPGDE